MATDAPLEYVAPEFGPAVKRWFTAEGLSQQTPHDWAQAADCRGPWNSQTSLLQRNLLACEPGFFISLARFNRAVAGEEPLPAELKRARRDQLMGAEPFKLDDGSLPTAAQWFALYVGELPVPERYRAPSVADLPEPLATAATAVGALTPEQRQQLLDLLAG
jgi:hypothetical protein